MSLWIPFGSFNGEEVTAINMQRHRKLAACVGNRMYDVIPKDENVTSRQLSPANLLETNRTSAEEGVVLLASVESDNCPHTMVVGVEGHSWSPRDMKHRQIWGVVQGGDTPTFDGSERMLESASIGDQPPKDVPHSQGRCVLLQRFLAPCDDVFCEEFHDTRIRLLPTRQVLRGTHADGASALDLG